MEGDKSDSEVGTPPIGPGVKNSPSTTGRGADPWLELEIHAMWPLTGAATAEPAHHNSWSPGAGAWAAMKSYMLQLKESW